jgi:hypothetical protein
MKIYMNATDAIIDLHNRGFADDFQLFGDRLLWLQKNTFILEEEFVILEYHKIIEPKRNMDKLIVFGIIAPFENIKGILVKHFSNYTDSLPSLLASKINEMNSNAGMYI